MLFSRIVRLIILWAALVIGAMTVWLNLVSRPSRADPFVPGPFMTV